MNLAKVKKLLPIIIVSVVVALIILAVIVALILKSQSGNSNSNPNIGNTPDTDPVYQKSAAAGLVQIAASPDPYQAVANMILKLPNKGTNFTLDYSYANNTFTLTLKKGSETQGTAEFNQFLAQNNVDKAYLKHLTVKAQ